MCDFVDMAHSVAVVFLFIAAIFSSTCQAGFYNEFYVPWGAQNVYVNDSAHSVALSLTKAAGPSFSSNSTFLFGSFTAQIKLVPGNSAGTVSAFFAISGTDNHDEIDFEFQGNVAGQPTVLHTNLFANGTGNREQNMNFWFDPSEDFHTYQILWNHEMILWFVDDIPIRVYHNIENVAPFSFPSLQPMVVSGCIYDASSWATEGGTIPVDYADAPFTVTYQDFVLDGCVAAVGNIGPCTTNYSGNWWEGTTYQTFNSDWANQMAWVREYYLTYDYCTDIRRFPTPPIECSYNNDLS